MASVDLAKNGSHRFATFVACGSEHSAVLTEQGTAITFGSSHDFRLGRRHVVFVFFLVMHPGSCTTSPHQFCGSSWISKLDSFSCDSAFAMMKLLLLFFATFLRSLCADELVDITEALASCEGEDEECSLELLQKGQMRSQKGDIQRDFVASEALADPSCSAAPECAKLKLVGNCCPNDAGISLGCCPGGGTSIPSPAAAAVPKDSMRLCQNNPACKELSLEGLCCPNPAGASLGCCDSEIEKQDMLGAAGPVPELAPPAATPGPLMTFYLYRVDNDQRWGLLSRATGGRC
eukprot:symbB.v1.2.022957.t1/scaffold2070.1/size90664/5